MYAWSHGALAGGLQHVTDRREVRKSNPLEQAKQYAFGVCRLLESDSALVGEPGTSYLGKLVFPWGYGVAFAGTDLGSVLPPERVICHGSPAGAARKEHGGGPSGDSRRGFSRWTRSAGWRPQ